MTYNLEFAADLIERLRATKNPDCQEAAEALDSALERIKELETKEAHRLRELYCR